MEKKRSRRGTGQRPTKLAAAFVAVAAAAAGSGNGPGLRSARIADLSRKKYIRIKLYRVKVGGIWGLPEAPTTP